MIHSVLSHVYNVYTTTDIRSCNRYVMYMPCVIYNRLNWGQYDTRHYRLPCVCFL